mmetsp:Transcript_14419/g.28465  ORF Transcript_14419/g.28465 Transcript_14419/m.28465 type:complete len:135 (-) Transcript_14419:963-1367(-)
MPGGTSPKLGARAALPLSVCSRGTDKPPKSAAKAVEQLSSPRFPPSAQGDSSWLLTPAPLLMGLNEAGTPGGNPEAGICCDENIDAGDGSAKTGGKPASGNGHIPGGNPSGIATPGGNPATGMAQAWGGTGAEG